MINGWACYERGDIEAGTLRRCEGLDTKNVGTKKGWVTEDGNLVGRVDWSVLLLALMPIVRKEG